MENRRRFTKKFILSNTILISLSYIPLALIYVFNILTDTENVVTSEDVPWIILFGSLFFLVWILIGVIISILRYLFTYYQITEDSLILYRGIIFKSKEVVPLNRIHAIDVKKNLIQKIFNISKNCP